MPVSDETKDALEDVKKGKPRKFVMLTKGVTIVSLVAYKKGATSKFIKEAKTAGTGAPSFGVIEGKGMDLVFKLSTTDGFKDAPVKDNILKKFLEDEAQIKAKPSFEIVEALPLVLDENDPLHARFIKLRTLATDAATKAPDRAADLNDLIKQIGAHLDADQADQAPAKLDRLEILLKSISAGTGTTAGGDTQQPDKQQVTYQALRAKLQPMLEQVKKSVPEKAEAYDKLWNFAEAQATAGNYAGANKGLAGLADALAKAKAGGGGSSVDVLAVWRDAKEDVDSQLGKFSDALRKAGDDYLAAIAEGGIHSFVEGPTRVFVTLQASLFDYKSAQGDKRDAARTKVLTSVQSYRQFVDQNAFLEVCDTNELCGPLTIRATLLDALTQLENAVSA